MKIGKLSNWQMYSALAVYVCVFFLGEWLGGGTGKLLVRLSFVFAIATGAVNRKK